MADLVLEEFGLKVNEICVVFHKSMSFVTIKQKYFNLQDPDKNHAS